MSRMGLLRGLMLMIALQGAGVAGGQTDQEPPRVGNFEITREGVRAGLAVEVLQRMGQKPNVEFFQKNAESPQSLITWGEEIGPPVWRVDVPDGYDPQRPPGVLIFCSAADASGPRGQWNNTLEDHNLIYITAQNAGNQRSVPWRITAALAGLEVLKEEYVVDENRIYISGFSGGGRVATLTMFFFPDLISGGIPMGGANHFRALPVTNKTNWFTVIENLDPARMRLAMSSGRYAYIVGADDNNREQVEAVAADMVKAGFKSTLIIEEGVGHKVPEGEPLDKALVFLDAPLKAAALEQYQAGLKLYERSRWSQAMEPLTRAARYGEGETAADAAAKVAEIQAKLDEQVAAIEAAIETGDRRTAVQGINQLKQQWREVLPPARLKELEEAARKIN